MKLLLILTLLQVPIISKYLTYREATTSAYAERLSIANVPDQRQLGLIQAFGNQYFDPLRLRVGSPLYVSSLYRSPIINRAAGGVTQSEHMILGDVVACDIDQDGRGKVENRALFFIIKEGPPFRKLIWEFGTMTFPHWCHVSWSPDPAKNIKKVYRSTRIKNRIIYQNFNPYE